MILPSISEDILVGSFDNKLKGKEQSDGNDLEFLNFVNLNPLIARLVGFGRGFEFYEISSKYPK